MQIMPKFTIEDIEKKYDLELDKVVEEIKKQKAKKVMLQFPEGLKPYSLEISKFLESKTNANISIWMGTCFGACDTPETDADLLIQFGHAAWGKKTF